jgi:hypothetical protein
MGLLYKLSPQLAVPVNQQDFCTGRRSVNGSAYACRAPSNNSDICFYHFKSPFPLCVSTTAPSVNFSTQVRTFGFPFTTIKQDEQLPMAQ